VDPRIFSAFSVVGGGAFDPDEISSVVGVSPTRSWRVGDRRSRNGVELTAETTSGWRFELGPKVSVELPALVEELLSHFSNHGPGLREIVTRTGAAVEVSVHVYMADQAPIGFFELPLLRRLVDLGANLDIDLYVVEEPDPPDS
jgi:hypothetical protein